MRRYLAAAAFSTLVSAAMAQTVAPQVTHIEIDDLFPIIPHGAPTIQNKYVSALAMSNYFAGASGIINLANFATPNAGTDQTAQIQAAINAANALGGAIVYAQPGVYQGCGLVTYSGVQFLGPASSLSTIQKTATCATYLIASSAYVNNTNFVDQAFMSDGITWDGNWNGSAGATGHCLILSAAASVLANSSFQNCQGDGVRMSQQNSADVSYQSQVIQVIAHHSRFVANGGNGLYSHDDYALTSTGQPSPGTPDNWMEDSVFGRNGANGAGNYNLKSDSSANWRIHHNTFYYGSYGNVYLTFANVGSFDHNQIQDDRTLTSSGNYDSVVVNQCRGFNVDNNTFWSTIGPIYYNPAVTYTSIDVDIGSSGDVSACSVNGNTFNYSASSAPMTPWRFTGTATNPQISYLGNVCTSANCTLPSNSVSTDRLGNIYAANINSAVKTLGECHIPFILPSSGTMGNNGALSAITALPATYANAWVYMPASAIAAGSAAGYYYAVFSSTTAATIYNNTYSLGACTPPASPAPFVTTGPGAYTQTTAANLQGFDITVPALGANDSIEVSGLLTYNNSAGAKTVILQYSSYQFTNASFTTSVQSGILAGFSNRGVTNAQVPLYNYANGAVSTSTSPSNYGSIDSTVSRGVIAGLKLATATDFIVLENIVVKYIPGV